MNIAVCINTLAAGGAEIFASSIALEYKRQGHNVIFIVLRIIDDKGQSLTKEIRSNNIELIDLEYKSKKDLLSYPLKIVRILRKNKIEVVHSHLEQMDMLVALASLFYRKPIIIRTLHSMNAFPGFNRVIHRFLFDKYNKSIGCGSLMKKNYTLPELREFIEPIDNGIKYVKFSDSDIIAIRKEIRNHLNIPEDIFVFLQIGRMTPVFGTLCKGHDFTINSVHSLHQKNFKVIFIGDDSSKNDPILYNQEFIEDDRLIFQGITSNPIKYILAADAILAPSRVEGLPISTLEGVFYSKPLICSNIEVFDIFKEDSTLRMDIKSPMTLSQKMIELIENYEIYHKNAYKNSNFYRDQYSIENTSKKYLTLISNLQKGLK